MNAFLLSMLIAGGGACERYFIYETSSPDHEMTIYVSEARSEVFFGHSGAVFQACELAEGNFCVRDNGLIIVDLGNVMQPGDRMSLDGYDIEYTGNSTLNVGGNEMRAMDYAILQDNELIYDVSFGRMAGLQSVYSYYSGHTFSTVCEIGAFSDLGH